MDKENNSYGSESAELHCPLAIETMNASGEFGKRIVHKKANLALFRNEFRDIILTVSSERDRLRYAVCNVTLHTKFIKEGKVTVVIDNRVRLFISNCAVDKLVAFLKILKFKRGKNQENQVDQNREEIRKRLLSDRKRILTEISPLTANEINAVKKRDVQLTPPGPKKMRLDDNKLMKRRLNIDRPMRNVELNEDQKSVMNAVLSGRNIFFTGSAGTGKSYLLKKIIRILPPETTFVTASTGVAAMQINGVTLHSFAGIGSGSANLEMSLKKIKASNAAQCWKKCQHLIVDEISMIQGDYFTKLEQIARNVRRNERPFGGIQLIVCGDFLQLPPVTKPNETRTFCFETKAWEDCIRLNMELKKVHRQQDKNLVSILQAIRLGVCTNDMSDVLLSTNKHQIERDGILATHLCTHNDDASYINSERLQELSGTSREFVAIDSDKHLSSWLDKQCPVESKLTLKVGTQVMLIKNQDVQLGLVNGSRGIVVKFNEENGFPEVKFKSGPTVTVSHHQWSVKQLGTEQISRRQLPLKLAWALSIHKAQGMTLDCVEMSLSKVFEYGQAYVGLSRASNLNGLKVLNFDKRCVRANPTVLEFYKHMKRS